MKNLLVSLIFLLLSFTLFAQEYPEVSIVGLNSVSDSLLENATSITDIGTSYLGDTVKIVGAVLFAPMVDWENDRRLTTSSASRGAYTTFIQDTAGNVWGGIMVEQPDSNFITGFDKIDSGDVVEITGVVSEGYYNNTTTLTVLVEPLTEIKILYSKIKNPDPIIVTIPEFFDGSNYIYEAEKYENMYVEFNNVKTGDRNPSGSANFSFTDGSGNKIIMYDQSGYFTTRGHRLVGNTDYETPADGTFLEHIRGIIHTRDDGWYMVPLYPGDMKVGTIDSLINPPSNLSVVANSHYSLDITWDDNSDNELGFMIERKIEGGTYTQLEVVNSNVVSYTNNNLLENTTYCYRVSAYMGLYSSTFSNESCAMVTRPPIISPEITLN